ncbi:MAG: protein kinase [Pseudomonadota bacterium]
MNNAGMLRVLVLDDDAAFSASVEQRLSQLWPELSLVARKSTHYRDTLSHDVQQANIVFLDHEFDQRSGLTLLRELRAERRAPAIIFVTHNSDERLAVAAIKYGADDYLPKATSSAERLVTTVKECLRATRVVASRRPSGAARTQPVTGVLVKGYRLIDKIAMGMGSVVYLAYSESRREDVVLKVLDGAFELADQDETFERFLIEIQSAAEVTHPNVIRIHDVGVADHRLFIAMEYIRGGSLRQRIARDGALRPRDALDLALNIGDALGVIHAQGILHRDLKPGNILFRDDGTPCLIDFGLAKHVQLDQEITLPGRIYGTPYYMSPEQGLGEEIDARSDFYSLGVVLFEALTGRKPFMAGTPVAMLYKHRFAPIPEINDKNKQYQPLIHSLMAKDPAERPTSVEDLLAVLNHYKSL